MVREMVRGIFGSDEPECMLKTFTTKRYIFFLQTLEVYPTETQISRRLNHSRINIEINRNCPLVLIYAIHVMFI